MRKIVFRCAIVMLGISAALIGCERNAGATIRFQDNEARRLFETYVEFLDADQTRYRAEILTVRQLERSDVEYRILVGGEFRPGVDGAITTDGSRVSVTISDGTGANGKGGAPCTRFSERACLAHELEHARQFDSLELAFRRDPASGRWFPDPASYDIGDEVNAWLAQLHVAKHEDFWRRPEGLTHVEPSLLARFASERSDGARADLLLNAGYGRVNPAAGQFAVLLADAAPPDATTSIGNRSLFCHFQRQSDRKWRLFRPF